MSEPKINLTEIDERDLKAKSLGAIKCVEVEGGKRLYLKMPHRNIIGIVMSQMKVNMIQASETLAKATAIREVSDMDIFENDGLFLSCISGINELLDDVQLKKSTSRNL